MIKRIIFTCFIATAFPFLSFCFGQDPVLPQGMTPSEIQKQAEAAERQYQEEENARKKAEEARIHADYELVRELEDLEEQKRAGQNVRGSCDIIAKESTCIEFYGSVWAFGGTMETSCRGNQGIFSKKPCPRNFVGGCNVAMA